MKRLERSLTLLNKRVNKYIIKKEIPVKQIDKKGATWSGYCVVTSVSKDIVINNNLNIYTKPFVILHEIGHYQDEEYIQSIGSGVIKNDKFEATADDFIYKFCRKYCSLFELYYLQNFIKNFSKREVKFSLMEKVAIRLFFQANKK